MDYSLRQASPSDLEYFFNLHRATMRDYVDATWGWNDEWQRSYFEQKFNPDESFIIQLHGQYAGVLVTEDRPEELYLSLIEVAPSYQNQGLGTAVISELQSQAAQAHKPMALHVLKANVPARRLYEELGFTHDSDEEHKIRMIWVPEDHARSNSSR